METCDDGARRHVFLDRQQQKLGTHTFNLLGCRNVDILQERLKRCRSRGGGSESERHDDSVVVAESLNSGSRTEFMMREVWSSLREKRKEEERRRKTTTRNRRRGSFPYHSREGLSVLIGC